MRTVLFTAALVVPIACLAGAVLFVAAIGMVANDNTGGDR